MAQAEASSLVAKPKVTITNFTYDGEEHAVFGSLPDNAHYSLSEGSTLKATDVGTYTATVTLDDGYKWLDDRSSTPYTVEWSIAPRELTVTPASKSIKYGETVTVDIDTYFTVEGFINNETPEDYVAPTPVLYEGEQVVSTTENLGVGTYTVKLDFTKANPTANYAFSDEEKSKTASLVVSSEDLTTISRPDVSTSVVYDGESHVPVAASDAHYQVACYSSNGTELVTEAVNAGEYKIKITADAGYMWADGNRPNDPIEYTLTIEKAPLTATVNGVEVSYNDEQDYRAAIKYYDNNGNEVALGDIEGLEAPEMTMTGVDGNSRTGEFNVVLTGGSATNYAITCENTGDNPGKLTVNAIVVEHSEALKEALAKNGLGATFTYNGESREGELVEKFGGTGIEVKSSAEVINTLNKVDAGTYTFVVTLKNGYVWADTEGVEKPKYLGLWGYYYQLSYTIEKMPLKVKVGDLTINQGEEYKTAKLDVTGWVNNESEELAGVTLPSVAVYDDDYLPVTGTLKPGTYKLGIANDGNGGTNYEFKNTREYVTYGTLTVQSKVAVPTADGKGSNTLVYSGSKVTFPASEYYTLSGNTVGKNVGDYEVTATLKDGCTWDDGTTGAKTIKWSITKAQLTATYENETVKVGETPKYAVKIEGWVGETEADVIDSDAAYKAPTVTPPVSLAAGTYKLTPANGAATNYTFNCVEGTLTVQAADAAKLSLSDTEAAKLAALKVGGSPVSVTLAYQGAASPGKATVACATGGVVSAAYNDATGVLTLTPLKEGSDTVTVTVPASGTFGEASLSIKATVGAKPAALAVDAAYTLTVGGNGQVISYEGALDYTLAKEGVIAVSKSADGKSLTVTPVAAGETTLTITAVGTGLDPVTVKFTVNAAPSSGDNNPGGSDSTAKPVVQLSPVSVAAGSKANGAVTITNAAGADVSSTVSVASSNEAVAKATYANGVLTVEGVAPGTATITLSSSEVASDYTVAVTVTAAYTLTADATSLSLKSGESADVVLGYDGPGNVQVAVADPAIASAVLTADGTYVLVRVTGLTAGTTTVTLSAEGASDVSIPVTVTAQSLNSGDDGTDDGDGAGDGNDDDGDGDGASLGAGDGTGTGASGTTGGTTTDPNKASSGTGLSKTGDGMLTLAGAAALVVALALVTLVLNGRRRTHASKGRRA